MGTCLNRLAEAVLASTHNLCFEQKYEKCQSFFFLSENFQFFKVKFSIYLDRRVFVMTGYYRIYEWRAKAQMILCACAG